MRVSYGPPGHRGVTSLMAVGDAEYEGTLERTARTGTLIAGAAAVIGVLTGSSTLRNLGAGGVLALLAVRAASRKKPALVAVTTPPVITN